MPIFEGFLLGLLYKLGSVFAVSREKTIFPGKRKQCGNGRTKIVCVPAAPLFCKPENNFLRRDGAYVDAKSQCEAVEFPLDVIQIKIRKIFSAFCLHEFCHHFRNTALRQRCLFAGLYKSGNRIGYAAKPCKCCSGRFPLGNYSGQRKARMSVKDFFCGDKVRNFGRSQSAKLSRSIGEFTAAFLAAASASLIVLALRRTLFPYSIKE